MPDDSENDEYITQQIAQLILRSDGCFVTSRIMTRKTGRKAKLIRNSFMALTQAQQHPEHIGMAKEIGKNMLVFYKCPPEQMHKVALSKYGLDLHTYRETFYGSLKSAPSQSILEAVLRDSPYVCNHYDMLLHKCEVEKSQPPCLPPHTSSNHDHYRVTPVTSVGSLPSFAGMIDQTLNSAGLELQQSLKKEARADSPDIDSSIDVLNDSDHHKSSNNYCERNDNS